MVEKVSRSSPVAWLVPVGMVVYPVLKFGGTGQPGSLLVGSALATAAYVLAIYLFYAIPTLVYRGRLMTVGAATVASLVVGMSMAGAGRFAESLGDPAMIALAGGLTGYLTLSGKRPGTVYLVGFGLLIIMSVMVYLPIWPVLMQLASEVLAENLEELKNLWRTSGISESQAEEVAFVMNKAFDVTTRLIPASMIMGVVIQFSVGFLLFFVRTVDDPVRVLAVKSFIRWKVPFEVMVAVIAAILMRLFGGETFKLVADNAILILSLYYCLGGLALVEYGMKRMGVSLPLRILFYIFLTLAGVVGFLITVLLGFIDSFVDWRKVASAEIGLKKSES